MDLKQNYFEVFDLPKDYSVDLKVLGQRFLNLQKEIHPDKFAGGSDQEKRLSMQYTTLANTANETLKSPLKRAIYMLELAGRDIEHNPQLPPEFLMKQISLREDLDDIEDGDLDAVDAFKAQVSGEMRELEANFAATVNDDLAQAETLVYEMQFMNRLLQAAKQLEEKMLDY